MWQCEFWIQFVKTSFRHTENGSACIKYGYCMFLLTVTRKFAAYFVLLNLTSIILFSFDSHSESEEELSMLS